MTCRKTKLIGVRERVVLRSFPWLIFLLSLASSGWATAVRDSVQASNQDCWVSGTSIYASGGSLIAGSSDASAPRHTGAVYPNFPVPAGAIIDSAFGEYRAQRTDVSVNCDLIIYGEDTASASVFSTYADFAARHLTTASVAWPNVESWTADVTGYRTPDLKTIFQEIVNHSGYTQGNNVALFVYDNGSSTGHMRYAWDWDNAGDTGAEWSPKILVWYHLAEAGTTSRRAEVVRHE